MTTISIKVPVSYEFNEKLGRIQDKMREKNGKMTSKAQILLILAQKGLKNGLNSDENAQKSDDFEQKNHGNVQNYNFSGIDSEQNSEFMEQLEQLNKLKEQIYSQKDKLFAEKEQLIIKEKEFLKQKEALILEKSEIKAKDLMMQLKNQEISILENNIETLKQSQLQEINDLKEEKTQIYNQFHKFEKFLLKSSKLNNEEIQLFGNQLLEKVSEKPEKNLLEKFVPLLPSALILISQFFYNYSEKNNPEFEKLKDGITAIYEKINKDECDKNG